MHQGAALEFEDRLPRVAVLLVLAARMLHPLARERVFQFHRGYGDSVEREGQVDDAAPLPVVARVFGVRFRSVLELPCESQPVGGVARFQLRVQLVRGLEVRRVERAPVALEAVAQRRERAVPVHPLAQVAEDLLAGPVPVERLQLGPLFGLRLTNKAEQCFGEDRAFAVEAFAGDRYVAILE